MSETIERILEKLENQHKKNSRLYGYEINPQLKTVTGFFVNPKTNVTFEVEILY